MAGQKSRIGGPASPKPPFKIGRVKTRPRNPGPPPRQDPFRKPGSPGFEPVIESPSGGVTQSSSRAAARQRKIENYNTYVRQVRGRDRDRGLRVRRGRGRLTPVEEGMLGQPYDGRADLPQAVGERWSDANGQVIATATTTTVAFTTEDYSTERVGYSQMYSTGDNSWTVPPGLNGIWRLLGEVRFAANTTGQRSAVVELNGTTNIWSYRTSPGGEQESMPICLDYLFDEGDYFLVRVSQSSGGNLALVAGAEYTQLSASFVGYA